MPDITGMNVTDWTGASLHVSAVPGDDGEIRVVLDCTQAGRDQRVIMRASDVVRAAITGLRKHANLKRLVSEGQSREPIRDFDVDLIRDLGDAVSRCQGTPTELEQKVFDMHKLLLAKGETDTSQ